MADDFTYSPGSFAKIEQDLNLAELGLEGQPDRIRAPLIDEISEVRSQLQIARERYNASRPKTLKGQERAPTSPDYDRPPEPALPVELASMRTIDPLEAPESYQPTSFLTVGAENGIPFIGGDVGSGLKRGWQGIEQAANIAGRSTGWLSEDEFARAWAENEGERQSYGTTPETKEAFGEFQEASEQGVWSALKVMLKRPRVLATVIAESVPSILPGMVGGIAGSVAGPMGAAGGVGLGSAAVEYTYSIADFAADRGIDMTKPENVKRMFGDEELMGEARDYALKRGLSIGAFDAITAGISSKIGGVVRNIDRGTKGATRRALTGYAAASGIEAIGGGGGEATAQLVTKGEVENWGDVLLEAGAEAAIGPVEAVGAMISRAKGTKADPVVAKTDADVQKASGIVNTEATPAQQEAGNYQKGHLDVNGLPISVETPRDSLRKSTRMKPDGTPEWEVVSPAAYGYVKGTVGADGEPVDVYIGPNPASEKAFIIDQNDAETGNFDEHKIIVGVDREADATDIYIRGFSDGKGADRLGAITEISIGDLKEWLKNGDTKTAIAGRKSGMAGRPGDLKGPISPGVAPPVEADDLPVGSTIEGEDFRARVIESAAPEPVTAGVSIRTPPNVRPPEDETAAVAGEIAKAREAIQAQKVDAPRIRGKVKRQPKTLTELISSRGGIKDTGGELRAMDVSRIVPGFGPLIRPTGMDPDEARRLAVEHGYLDDRGDLTGGRAETTPSDLFDAINQEVHGVKVRSTRAQELEDAETAQAERQTEETANVRAEVEDAIREFDPNYDMTGVEPVMSRVMELYSREGMNVDDAIERAFIELQDEVEGSEDDGGEQDIPFGELEADREDVSGEGGLPPETGDRDERPGEIEQAQGASRAGESAVETERLTGQAAIPGTEAISDAELAQRRADQGLKPKADQQAADVGIFGSSMDQTDLVDMSRQAKPVTPPDTSWLDSLDAETKERAFAAMRAIDEKSVSANQKAADLAPRGGALAVGGADFDDFIRGEGLRLYLSAIRKGSTPEAALEATKPDMVAAVRKHNARRPDDVNWKRWEESGQSYVEDQHRSLLRATEGPKPERPSFVDPDRNRDRGATVESEPTVPRETTKAAKPGEPVPVTNIERTVADGNPHVDLGEWIPTTGKDIGIAARDYVVEKGRETMLEHMIALNPDGVVLAHGYGGPANTGMNNELWAAVKNPEESVVIHHNHPQSRPLSTTDIGFLAYPGIESVWAYGHDGTQSRAALTPEAADRIKKLSETIDPYKIVRDSAPSDAMLGIQKVLQTLFNDRSIDLNTAERAHLHLANMISSNAGIIDYETDIPIDNDILSRPDIKKEIEDGTKKARKWFFGDDAIGSDRRTKPIRHPAEMGISFARDRKPSGQRPDESVDAERGERESGGEEGGLAEPTPFYSAVLGAAVNIPQAKGAGDQMLAMLRKQSGVKSDELDWLDVEGFLKGKKSVTKDDLIEYIRANQVRVEEVEKGTPPPLTQEQDDRLRFLEGKDADGDRLTDDERTEYDRLLELNYDAEGLTSAGPKFSQYVLPGGENYRELLLTLPARDTVTTERVQSPQGWGDTEGGNVGIRRRGDTGADFRSSHWDEPNVLAHVRFNERADADGKRTLFIEEIQSDWHQAGRSKGYATTGRKNAVEARLSTARAALNDDFGITTPDPSGRILRDREGAEFDIQSVHSFFDPGPLNDAVAEYRSAWWDWKEIGPGVSGAVPDAPLKKTWQETAFRRMVRYAAENGFDQIAWTPGEVQAERYDLSKQVDAIGWQVDGGVKRVTIEIERGKNVRFEIDENGVARQDRQASTSIDAAIEGRAVEDIVGKEVAEKINAANRDTLSGGDLKIGGEGMKGFYDRILPAYANKFGKKFGAKVGTTTLTSTDEDGISGETVLRDMGVPDDQISDQWAAYTQEERDQLFADYRAKKSVTEAWALPITPLMRKVALEEGFPLFSLTDKEKHRMPFRFDDQPFELTEDFVKALDDKKLEAVFNEARRLLPKNIQVRMEEADKWTGRYISDLSAIYLATKDPKTLRHEGIHAFKDMGLFTDNEWSTLLAEASKNDWVAKHRIDVAEYTKIFEKRKMDPAAIHLAIMEEAVAEEFGSRYDAKLKLDPVSRLMARLKRFIESIRNGLKGLGFADADSIFRKIDEGAFADRTAQATGQEPMFSTDAFSRWFGDSKVVDENGEPLVVYHGTTDDFDTFERTEDIGFHFGSKMVANARTGSSPDVVTWAVQNGGPFEHQAGRNIIPAYLKIENPLRLEDLNDWSPDAVVDALWEAGVVSADQQPDNAEVTRERVRDWLAEKGYDGIVYENIVEAQGLGGDSYIVFDPGQIKSVNNRGAFDPSDPRISYQLRKEAVDGYMALSKAEEDAILGRPLSFTDRRAQAAGMVAKELVWKYHDKYIDLRQFVAKMESQLGIEFMDTANPGRAETGFAGRSDTRQEKFEDTLYTDFIRELSSASFTASEFENYLGGLHAYERNKHIRDNVNPDNASGSGITDKDAQQLIRELEASHGPLADFDQQGRVTPKSTEFENLRSKYFKPMIDFALDIRLEEGLIDQEHYDTIKKMYQYYVPLKGRDIDGETWSLVEKILGYNIKGSGLKRAYGRSTRARGIVPNVIADARSTIIRAEKNRVPLAFEELLTELKTIVDEDDYRSIEEEFAKIEKTKFVRLVIEKGENIGRIVRVPKGVAVGGADALKAWIRDPMQNTDPSVIHGMKDGKMFGIRIQAPRLAQAFRQDSTAASGAGMEKLLRLSQNIVRYMTKTLTQWNPDFMLPNWTKDVQTAGINLSGATGKNVAGAIMKDSLSLVPKLFRLETRGALNRRARFKGKPGKQAQVDAAIVKDYEEAKKFGAFTGIPELVADPEAEARRMSRKLKQAAGEFSSAVYGPHGRLAYRATAYNMLDAVVQGVDGIMDPMNNALENATRLSVYRHLRHKEGWTPAKAAEASKNVTTNFNRKGMNKAFSQLYMFAQPAINGNMSMFQMGFKTKQGRRLAYAATSTIMALTLYNTLIGAMGADDDEMNLYEKIPDYERARYAIIMLPFDLLADTPLTSRVEAVDGRFFSYLKIPLPWGFSFFTNTGRILTEYTIGQTTNAYDQPLTALKKPVSNGSVLREVFNDFMESFSPAGTHDNFWIMLTPTALRPFAEIGWNTAFHGGAIAPSDPWNQNPNPSGMAKLRTPEFYRAISEKLNKVTGGDDFEAGALSIPPDYIEHLVDTYGGGTKRIFDSVYGMTNAAASMATGEPYDPQALRTHKWPILRRFLGGDRDFMYQSHYYDFRNGEFLVFESARRTAARKGEAPELRKAAAEKITSPEMAVSRRMKPAMDATRKRLRTLRSEKKLLRKDPSVTPGEMTKRDGELRDLSTLAYMRATGELRFVRREVMVDQDATLSDQDRTRMKASINQARSRMRARVSEAEGSIRKRGGRGVVVDDQRVREIGKKLELMFQ